MRDEPRADTAPAVAGATTAAPAAQPTRAASPRPADAPGSTERVEAATATATPPVDAPSTAPDPSPSDPPTSTTPPPTAECRICLEPASSDGLVSPCSCTGTVAYAHVKCLQTWVEERRGLLVCEICGAPYSADLTPVLADAARRGRERAAQAAAAAHAALAVGGPGVGHHPEGGGCLGGPRARAWAAAALVFVVALALLYVVLFVGGDHQPSYWAVLLLRVLAFVLPLYLIAQVCLAFVRYRRARAELAGVAARRAVV